MVFTLFIDRVCPSWCRHILVLIMHKSGSIATTWRWNGSWILQRPGFVFESAAPIGTNLWLFVWACLQLRFSWFAVSKRLCVVLWLLLLLVRLALVWGVKVALACRRHYVRAVLLRCQVLIALFLDQIEWPLLWRHLRIGPVFAHLHLSLVDL